MEKLLNTLRETMISLEESIAMLHTSGELFELWRDLKGDELP